MLSIPVDRNDAPAFLVRLRKLRDRFALLLLRHKPVHNLVGRNLSVTDRNVKILYRQKAEGFDDIFHLVGFNHREGESMPLDLFFKQLDPQFDAPFPFLCFQPLLDPGLCAGSNDKLEPVLARAMGREVIISITSPLFNV